MRAGHRWIVAASFGVVAAYVLTLFGLSAMGIGLAALCAVNIVLVLRARLSADRAGVAVVNLGPEQRIPWSEIGDVRVGRSGRARCLEIRRLDGTRVHAFVTTFGLPWDTADDIDALVQRLRKLQAVGLVAAGRVDADTLSRLLLERDGSAAHAPALN